MIRQEVQWIPIRAISWDPDSLHDDSRETERMRVDSVIQEFHKHGNFKPVRIKKDEPPLIRLVDGSHRMRAAIEMEWDTIPCTSVGPYWVSVKIAEFLTSAGVTVASSVIGWVPS